MIKPLIQLKGVSKSYQLGKSHFVHALKNINLEIHTGDFLAVMGPSGSGKSTLLHIIGFLDKADSGEIIFNGENIQKISPRKFPGLRNKKIGFVFQTFNLLPRFSAFQNVALPLSYARVSGSKKKEKAWEALKSVGLENRAKHKPSELSGGELQRVAIARALVNNPEIILADEPTGNLDTKSGQEVIEILKELNKKGITVILVTHDPNIARPAQKIVEMIDGEIKEKGE